MLGGGCEDGVDLTLDVRCARDLDAEEEGSVCAHGHCECLDRINAAFLQGSI